ncbi:MAG TPA: hypothetical protein VKR32_01300 [Puia sp.]|nr:hypothetical protein [Puia sp.]
MKKYLIAVASITLCCIVLNSYATDVNEKVLNSFKQTFPNVHNVSWQSLSRKYVAQFELNGVRTVVNYDFDGNITEAIRYYMEENLPMNIVLKLKKQFPDQKVFGITEVTAGDNVEYYIKLESEKNWTTVRMDNDGSSEIVEKYEKQQ